MLAGLVALAASALVMCGAPEQTGHARSVRPQHASGKGTPAHFDPAQSAALFVGVSQFADHTIAEVPYAVDDAVDLAHAFVLEARQPLVTPRSVVLALSGQPRKHESIEKLKELTDAGATTVAASRTEILQHLQSQARSVRQGGIFILSFASHGFSEDGVPYVLASSSQLNNTATAISASKILDLASVSTVPRSVIFLDACRERVTAVRGAARQPRSRAPLLAGLSKTDGQVVFFAAGAGQYAYDDDRLKNGVFTESVLAGLRCKAETDAHGNVTAGTLSEYVEKHVRLWLQRRHRNPPAHHATQVSMDGDTALMPLASCGSASASHPSGAQPGRVDFTGSALHVLGENGMLLWQQTLDGPIVQAAIADLDANHQKEVIVAAGGKIVVFNASGERLWSADTNAPSNYDGARAMTVRSFVIGRVTRKKTQQVVALSTDNEGRASRLSLFRADGRIMGGYWHPGPLQHVVIGALTSRHAPKIIVTGVNRDLSSLLHVKGAVGCVFLLDPNKVSGEAPPYHGKLGSGSQVWYGYVSPMTQTIKHLEIAGHDGTHDISLSTSRGHVVLDFDGRTLDAKNAHVSLVKTPRG